MNEFRDTTNLTKWTIRFLYLQAGLCVLSIITGVLEMQATKKVTYNPDNDIVLNDIVVFAWAIVFFTTGIMILR